MKKNSNNKMKLVLTFAVCVLFVALAFSSAMGKTDVEENLATGNEENNENPTDPTPPRPGDLFNFRILNRDWNYWSNKPNLFSMVTGNVGIGTETPMEKLDVVGTLQTLGFKMPTGATSGHVLTADSSGTGSWQAPPTGIGGSGTTDFVPKFTGFSTIGDSSIYEDSSGNVGIGTTTPMATLDVVGNIKANNVGSVFIRWGNGTAPEGTTLIYSGFAYAGHHNYLGTNEPIVIQTGGEPGPSSNSESIVSPFIIAGETPPGIVAGRSIKAAVCYADSPTVQIWGNHTAPPGWKVVYRGYAMGPRLSYHGPIGPIIVDCEHFDASTGPGNYYSYLFSIRVYGYAPGDQDFNNKYLKCMVVQKE